MKRTIQGLLVTSVLLIGCANSTVKPMPTADPVSDTMTTREIIEVRKNLTGICYAIIHHGLPLDHEIRAYVRGRTEPVSSVARAGSPVDARTKLAARNTINYLTGEYAKCDPVMARDMSLATKS